MIPPRKTRSAGFTLTEMAVSLTIMLIAGGTIFTVIRNVALLGAKNGAVNYTHQQSREMLHHAVSQLHSAISIPVLADAALADASGNGPTAGVKYQTLVAGPNRLYSNVTAGSTTIKVTAKAGAPAIVSGMRLIVPAFDIEEDITSVSGPVSSPVSPSGTAPVYTLTLAHAVPNAITCSTANPNFVAYYTQRSALVVVGTDLRWYQRVSSGSYVTVANDVTTATPFSIPGGDNRYVQASFSFRDPKIGAMNLKSMRTSLVLTVPYRARLTSNQ